MPASRSSALRVAAAQARLSSARCARSRWRSAAPVVPRPGRAGPTSLSASAGSRARPAALAARRTRTPLVLIEPNTRSRRGQPDRRALGRRGRDHVRGDRRPPALGARSSGPATRSGARSRPCGRTATGSAPRRARRSGSSAGPHDRARVRGQSGRAPPRSGGRRRAAGCSRPRGPAAAREHRTRQRRRRRARAVEPRRRVACVSVVPFIDRMDRALALADWPSRARARASPSSPRAALPSILVPYPYATENHQEANARELGRRGRRRAWCSTLTLSSSTLVPAILDLVEDGATRDGMAEPRSRGRARTRPSGSQRSASRSRGRVVTEGDALWSSPPGSIPTLPVPRRCAGIGRVHLIGIGGAGMRNLARLLLARGRRGPAART